MRTPSFPLLPSLPPADRRGASTRRPLQPVQPRDARRAPISLLLLLLLVSVAVPLAACSPAAPAHSVTNVALSPDPSASARPVTPADTAASGTDTTGPDASGSTGPVSRPTSSSSADAADDPTSESSPGAVSGTWKGCMISRADLEAETGKPSTIAPQGGEVLLMAWTSGSGDYQQRLKVLVGLKSAPSASQTVSFEGSAGYQLMEMGGGIETGDTATGKFTTKSDPMTLDVTVASQGNLRSMFQAEGIHHFSLPVLRIKRTRDCK